MRLLVLGGTVFLSQAVAADAVARGHDVVCACRGTSGAVPDGARHVTWDREQPLPEALAGEAFDAVVDVARHPSRVRAAVEAFPDAHWVFVSTINVYADNTVPGGTPDRLVLLDPIEEDRDPSSAPEVYGGMKVACERLVQDGAASSTVIRPGLIVGPGDPSGRFAYWPLRLADGGEVLAPGSPDDPVQVVDVRDLAAWAVACAAERRVGTFDGSGRVTSRAEFLAEVARGVAGVDTFTWVPQEFLVEQEVDPWSGDRALPVWLPLPEYAGLMAHDTDASFAAGLTTRPLFETAHDTLAWLRATPDATVTGISRADEAGVLAAWHRAAEEGAAEEGAGEGRARADDGA